jgi:hypothetical protein
MCVPSVTAMTPSAATRSGWLSSRGNFRGGAVRDGQDLPPLAVCSRAGLAPVVREG